MTVTVFYHGGGCLDGMTAAWLLHQRYPDAVFHPVNYDQPPPCYPTGELIIADFIYHSLSTMQRLVETASRTVVLDHHPDAKPLIERLNLQYPVETFEGIYRKDQSGAGLVWRHLYPGQEPPRLVAHVEDRDLWHFVIPNTKRFCDGLRQLAPTFASWDVANRNDQYDHLLARGDLYARQEDVRFGRLIDDHGYTLQLDALGRRLPAVHTDAPGERSELAQALLRRSGESLVAVSWQEGERYRVRLCSSEQGPDVNVLANAYGGGGHPHAAGFYLSPLEFTFCRLDATHV